MVPGQFTHGRRRCAVSGAEDHSLVVNQQKVAFANLLSSFGFIRTGTINVSKLARSSL